MSDQGKANYEAYRKLAGRPGVSAAPLPEYERLPMELAYAFDAGADAVEAWLAEAPVDEDMPGNEPAELAQLRTERHRYRATALELLGEFGSTGRGWNVARISDEHLSRLRARMDDQPDAAYPDVSGGGVPYTPGGYQGAAAHTFTTGCDGFHPIGEQCNLPAATETGQ